MEVELKAEGKQARLNGLVAVTVAILSVVTAIGNIKNSNIVQQMAFTKGNSVDVWNQYQATRIKLHTDEDALGTVTLSNGSDVARAAETKRLQDKIGKYTTESAQLKKKAEGEDARYGELLLHHDQFDMSEALDSVAISLAAVAALTELFWLLCISWGFGTCGILMAIAGFTESNIHPDFLARLLG
jgi:hypothetical protein